MGTETILNNIAAVLAKIYSDRYGAKVTVRVE